MFNKSCFFLLLLIVVFSSCSSGNNAFMDGAEIVYSDAPVINVNIQGTLLDLPEEELLGVSMAIPLTDSTMVLTYFKQEYRFRYVNLKDRTFHPFLYVGRGPQEMMMSTVIGIQRRPEGKVSLWVYDMNTCDVNEIGINESVQAGAGIFLHTFKIPSNINRVFLYDKDLLCQSLMGENGFCYLLSGQDGSVKKRIEYLGEHDYSDDFRFFESVDCLHPNGAYLALCMSHLDKINIIDLMREGRDKTIVTDQRVLRESDERLWQEYNRTFSRNDYYRTVRCSDKHIFTLYGAGDELRVFDWAGNYLCRAKLAEPMKEIYLDMENSYILAVSKREQVFRYRIADLQI